MSRVTVTETEQKTGRKSPAIHPVSRPTDHPIVNLSGSTGTPTAGVRFQARLAIIEQQLRDYHSILGMLKAQGNPGAQEVLESVAALKKIRTDLQSL
jgi:hypothetical protein